MTGGEMVPQTPRHSCAWHRNPYLLTQNPNDSFILGDIRGMGPRNLVPMIPSKASPCRAPCSSDRSQRLQRGLVGTVCLNSPTLTSKLRAGPGGPAHRTFFPVIRVLLLCIGFALTQAASLLLREGANKLRFGLCLSWRLVVAKVLARRCLWNRWANDHAWKKNNPPWQGKLAKPV